MIQRSVRSVAVMVLSSVCGAMAVGAGRPNIVVILADDLGYGSVGCYGADARLIRTPAIDRLAREGRRFTDASTPSSVCTPTRYALLTGRYCWRSRLNTGRVLNTFDPLLIEPDRPTIASMLKECGYRTGFVGKWHLGYGTARRVDYTKELKPGPLELGFDYQFAVPQNHNDVTRVFVENHRVYGLRSSKLTPEQGNVGLDAPQRDDPTTMEQLTDRAVAWLQKQQKDEPFFLYFAPVAVHELVTPSADTQGTSTAGPYGDFIHDLDLSVGRILGALDELKAADSTLVIFTSDNGGVVAAASKSGSQKIAMDAGLAINGSLRGGKHDIYEGGFRVPFIVRWPGRVPAGTASGEMINLTDIYATLAAVVGESAADPRDAAPDSFNVLPAFLGDAYKKPLRPSMILQSADGVYAIRQGPWKWIEGKPQRPVGARHPRKNQHRPCLVRLDGDPGETIDVAPQEQEVAQRLSKLLDGHRARDASRSESTPPKVTLSNGVVAMSLYLPDPVDGYYRGSRFDWSGVVSQLRYKGHDYFGEWQVADDPTLHDRICGPVESFQAGDLAWGYTEAAAGEGFVKIGIGVLEKPDESSYRWNGTYKLIDPGTWTLEHTEDSIAFRHELTGPRGMAYVYTKTMRLTREPPGFTIDHELRNTGGAVIETSQYNHNFFVIDGLPSGPDVTVRFPFEPKATHDLKGLLQIKGKELVYPLEFQDQSIFTGLEGFGPGVSDHEMHIENRRAGAGVRISVDRPLYRLNFWSIRTTVCPENYIHLRIVPGAQERWKSTYVLYTMERS